MLYQQIDFIIEGQILTDTENYYILKEAEKKLQNLSPVLGLFKHCSKTQQSKE